MADNIIVKTRNLSYSFKNGVKTLNDINLEVPKGSIYGFLGPNGAGKTTTLRLLLGLLKKQQGQLEVFGQPFHSHRMEILKRLGSLIEQPSLYLHLSALENMEIYRLIYHASKSRVENVLELVGLQATRSKKVRQFSLGMRQRLAIGIALLPLPELLILDEPTNGLDPNGIIEIRELIRKLNRENGTTIIVSSHILIEVEKMATHVGIIHKGRMLFQGPLQELQQIKTCQRMLEIETSDNEKAFSLLSSHYDLTQKEHQLVLPYNSKEESALINRRLINEGLDVYSLYARQNDLEQLFIDITSENA